MAWRFKASKYKNAAPIIPKPEQCVRDIVVGSYQTFGNNIAASARFMAFVWEHTGASVGVLTLDDCGRKGKGMPLLHAHSDTVTDLQFSPFHDGLLATSSQDNSVKIWHIPENGLEHSLSNPECTFLHKQRKVETVGFHPTADCLLYATAAKNISLYDLISQKEFFTSEDHSDVIQSLSWKQDGTLFATNSKDKFLRIVDPRIDSPIVQCVDSHQNIKDSRVVWLGCQNRILTTGFDANRMRQVMIRDVRCLKSPEKVLELDCSTGILMPLYDSDTNMLFLAGKGDTTIGYHEVTDKEPFLIEGLRHSGEQTKGACLVPKRALKVMEGEVNRVLQLTSNSIIPIMYQVPRKTYRDFHADLYPDTVGYKTDLVADEWQKGKNFDVPKISLDPAQRENGDQPMVILRGNLQEFTKNIANIKNQINDQNLTKNAQKIPFVPIKTKIKKIEEQQFKQEPQQTEFEQKFKSILSNKENKTVGIEKPIESNYINSCGLNNHQNGKPISNKDKDIDIVTEITKPCSNTVIPPKPLPRTSISDQGSFDESTTATTTTTTTNNNNSNNITPPAPKPKPRTNTSNYKPRLGPKPFSSEPASDFVFEKVFSVPLPPGSAAETSEEKSDSNNHEKPEEKPEEIENTLEKKCSLDDAEEKSDNSNGKQEEPDQTDNQKTTIAERKKLYENNSQSEEKQPSPPILRKESSKPRIEVRADSNKFAAENDENGSKRNDNSKRTSTVFGKVSKYRHLKGTTLHKSTHIENLKNISRQLPGECDGFHVNAERAAVPLAGAGGKIAIFELSKTGRLPDGVIPSLVNGTNIMDFQWNPFNPRQLAVACDDGSVKLWMVPEGGLTEPTNTPDQEINAHNDKIYILKYHPLAENVILTASYDMTIKLWDLTDLSEKICLKGHTDQIFGLAWSPCGKFIATVCKDGKIRIYDPRTSNLPINEGNGGPIGTRGARISYAIDGKFIVITGFDKVSERQIYLFRISNLDQYIGMVGLDVAPAILIPFYDEDSSTLFVTGKGDSTIFAYEVTDDPPYLCPLSHHRCASLHQGLSFLTKNNCDVRNVEFAKSYRLTNNSIEPLSFTVPRLKIDYFQDDLFPPTKVLWNPTLSSGDWFMKKNKAPILLNLKPTDMETLSSIQQPQTQQQNNNKKGEVTRDRIPSSWSKDDIKKQQEDIKNSVSARVQVDFKLEQDDMEGVEEKEWEE